MNTTDPILDAEFILRSKAVPLPCAHRPLWRMSVVLLLIEQCYGERATVEQLHVLNWAIRSDQTRQQFLDFIRGRRVPSQVNARRDPSLNRALEFAYAENLIAVETSGAHGDRATVGHVRVRLDSKGHTLIDFIKQNDDCFVVQKRFLQDIGRKVTQSDVAQLFTGGA